MEMKQLVASSMVQIIRVPFIGPRNSLLLGINSYKKETTRLDMQKVYRRETREKVYNSNETKQDYFWVENVREN